MRHTPHGYWLEEAGAVEPAPRLEEDRSVDVVVVGGGYTGMWAAWWVKALEPEASVVLLEADVCGRGPSGRNGGFCNSMWFSLPNMRRRWGDAGALAVARAAREAIDGVEGFCREEEVDAWFRRGGYLQVSTAPAHDGTWDEAVAACRELAGGEGSADSTDPAVSDPAAADPVSPHPAVSDPAADPVSPDPVVSDPATTPAPARPLSPSQVSARCASPAFRGGALYPDAATVQPARLALGLRRRLLDAGVEIYEHSPVRRLAGHASDIDHTRGGSMSDASGGAGTLRAWTARGTVRAGTAIVAIGAAAKATRGPLHNALTVTSSHIVLTEPVPEALEEVGWTGGECITDCRTMLHYFRTTPDGRIAFGWGGGRIEMGARLRGRAELDPDTVAAAARRLYEYFPALAEGAGPRTAPGGRNKSAPTAGRTGRGERGPARITHAWGGPIDVSPTHLPLIAPLRGGRAFAAAGYTGNGVGPSHMVGRTLASLALDRSDDHSRLPFIDPAPQRVPPEPLHWLGGEAIRHALLRKEEAECDARSPSLISRAISNLPKLVGFHIGR